METPYGSLHWQAVWSERMKDGAQVASGQDVDVNTLDLDIDDALHAERPQCGSQFAFILYVEVKLVVAPRFPHGNLVVTAPQTGGQLAA